jgi:hypothetical protein
MDRRALNAIAPMLLILGGMPDQLVARGARPQANEEKVQMTTPSKFYCNIKALNPL